MSILTEFRPLGIFDFSYSGQVTNDGKNLLQRHSTIFSQLLAGLDTGNVRTGKPAVNSSMANAQFSRQLTG